MIAKDINPLVLASLPLKERNNLPNCPAIYFVIADDSVIYIGKATSLASRWVNHHKWSELKKINSPMNIAWLEYDDATLLDEIEVALIKKFRPRLNVAKCKSSNKEIRGYVSNRLNQTFRVVAVLKDINLSDALTEAVEDWLKKPENQEIIKKHNLEK